MEKQTLSQHHEKLWTYEGQTVKFFGFPFSTRTTIVKLDNQRLWVHSPSSLNKEIKEEIDQKGTVEHLISPNKLHHLYLKEWGELYPGAKFYASPGLIKKRKDLNFKKELQNHPEKEWENQIDQTIIKGSPVMEEVIFFHKASRTLILTDLIENIRPEKLNWWQRKIAGFVGTLAPKGKTPLDWRLTFKLGNKEKAQAAIKKMLDWKPEKIILSHGENIEDKAEQYLEENFQWLLK